MSFLDNFFQSLKPTTNSKTANSSKLLAAMQTKDSLTENGAITHSTSGNSLLDLFFLAGASRTISDADLEILLAKSFQFDELLTLKLIFWAGDIRGGAGERRFFRLALKWLEKNQPEILKKNITAGNIQFYNRFDSLFELTDNQEVVDEVLNQVVFSLENKDGLLAKWLPRKKQYNNFKKLLQKRLNINDQMYRKLIVSLSSTVEQKISAKQWDQVEYTKVPSQAFNKYREAFLRNDETRFNQFIELALKGEVKINAGAIFPHQLYQAYNQSKDENSIVAQWNNLPNYLVESKERILPICDVSGSMTGLPMDVSVALGIYISERNEGVFKNAFITFSENPKIQILQGTLVERISQLQSADWGMNTDLHKVFKTLLQKANSEKLEQSDMPTMLLIFSDMEFDQALTGDTNLESIRKEYQNYGYELPKIIFWNLNGRLDNTPAKEHDSNIALVSSFSPTILKSILNGKTDQLTPSKLVSQILEDQRYNKVLI
jgi:hypothetical protein